MKDKKISLTAESFSAIMIPVNKVAKVLLVIDVVLSGTKMGPNMSARALDML